MKVALVHDWFVNYAGAERVVEQMLVCYPQADLFSLVDFLPEGKRDFIMNKTVMTSFIQKLPFAKKKYRSYLPLMPLAIEQFDLSEYDLILSSSHAIAKGIITGPDQLHICMCYTPIRYAWDLQHQYLKESGLDKGVKGVIAKWILHKIRIWDVRTSNGVDEFIAISKYIQRRINKVYRRESSVIYPPVYVKDFEDNNQGDNDYYFTFSRMVPYKKIDLIVQVFTEFFPDKKLIVIGEGPDFSKIESIAGNNVTLMGYQPFDVLKEYLSGARAFIFAAEEDFGIAPLEAQACGVPVIAYAKGGALETINANLNQSEKIDLTGVFYNEQTKESLKEAVEYFEKNEQSYTSDACVRNAERFSDERFRQEFKSYVDEKYSNFRELVDA